jgi:threonine dehydrogenase-like Zn-dependent dehydrogenase
MHAIVLEKPLEFHHADIDPPAKPGPGEALVRPRTMGICGTDVSGFHGSSATNWGSRSSSSAPV